MQKRKHKNPQKLRTLRSNSKRLATREMKSSSSHALQNTTIIINSFCISLFLQLQAYLWILAQQPTFFEAVGHGTKRNLLFYDHFGRNSFCSFSLLSSSSFFNRNLLISPCLVFQFIDRVFLLMIETHEFGYSTIIISTVEDYYVVHPDKGTVYFFDEPILQ